jgi:ADP-ribose pyrophosphatase YjhB (NUDIX family)
MGTVEEIKYERSAWAGGLLLRDEHVLMVHNEWPDAHVWSLPGGYSPPGEPLRETVRRELREEAGLEVEVGELAMVVENVWPPDERGVRSHALAVVYHVQAMGEPAGPQDPDGWVHEVRWVPVTELEAYLEPARQRGLRALWEPLADYVDERWQGGRFYSYAQE